MKVQCLRHEEVTDTLAVPAAQIREVFSDRGIEDAGSGPPRSRLARGGTLSFHYIMEQKLMHLCTSFILKAEDF